MSTVRRIYVEKKAPFAGKARDLRHEISGYLGIKSVEEVRIFIRYDVENVSDEVFEKACRTVFFRAPCRCPLQRKYRGASGREGFQY